MISPADGAHHAPIVDPALSADRDDARDPAQRETDGRPADERNPLGGDDARAADRDGRTPAERDEEQRYAQDRNSATPYNAEDNPDVISLDEQHTAESRRTDGGTDVTATDSDERRPVAGESPQTHRADVSQEPTPGDPDRERDQVAADRDNLAQDRDQLAREGALGTDARLEQTEGHRAGQVDDIDALGSENGRPAGTATGAHGGNDGDDRVHDLRDNDASGGRGAR